jgi:hypothetical protein
MQRCKGRRTLNNAFNALIFNNHMYLMHKKTGERERRTTTESSIIREELLTFFHVISLN